MPHKKRILILSLAAGAGHVQAAEALVETARRDYPELAVKHLEMSSLLDLGLRPSLTATFHFFARYLPSAWGVFYHATDNKISASVVELISNPLRRIGARRLYQAIRHFSPDHIICTNGIAAMAVSLPPPSEMRPIPFSIVMTDYAPHQYWAVPDAAFYFVPTEQIRDKLSEDYGMAREKIIVSGIPVHPKFYSNKITDSADISDNLTMTQNKLLARDDLAPDTPIILILAGGEGLLPIDKAVDELLKKLPSAAQIIAIAGYNKKLYGRLRQLRVPAHIKLIILGWTNRLDEYMRLANVVISKPGGLTTAECMAIGKPLIALSPIPGLEEKNAEYIESLKAGQRVDEINDLIPAVTYYLEHSYAPLHQCKHKTPATRCILESLFN